MSLTAPEASSHVAPVDVTLLGDCRVVGTGERGRKHDDGAPFEVFPSPDAREAAFVIARPEVAHVAWSHFPGRADDGRTRAHVDLGGQAHVRFSGFAGLYGRTFTTTKRMDSVAGHLWARAGAAVDVMSAIAGGDVFVRVATPFAAPKTIVVQGNCADLEYTPDATARAPSPHGAAVTNRTPTLPLFASPSLARPFTTITVASGDVVAFDVVEQNGDFVRVTAREDDVGIDAWVRAADVAPVSSSGALLSPRGTIAPAIDMTLPHARVVRDTPLVVGFEPGPLPGAFVEKGAIIVLDASSSTDVAGVTVVSFDFEDGFIVAPEGHRMWIARDALGR